MSLFVLTQIMDLDDILMVQPGNGLTFPKETLYSFFAGLNVGQKPLHRHIPVKLHVQAPVNLAHPSFAQNLNNTVPIGDNLPLLYLPGR